VVRGKAVWDRRELLVLQNACIGRTSLTAYRQRVCPVTLRSGATRRSRLRRALVLVFSVCSGRSVRFRSVGRVWWVRSGGFGLVGPVWWFRSGGPACLSVLFRAQLGWVRLLVPYKRWMGDDGDVAVCSSLSLRPRLAKPPDAAAGRGPVPRGVTARESSRCRCGLRSFFSGRCGPRDLPMSLWVAVLLLGALRPASSPDAAVGCGSSPRGGWAREISRCRCGLRFLPLGAFGPRDLPMPLGVAAPSSRGGWAREGSDCVPTACNCLRLRRVTRFAGCSRGPCSKFRHLWYVDIPRFALGVLQGSYRDLRDLPEVKRCLIRCLIREPAGRLLRCHVGCCAVCSMRRR